MSTIGIIKRVRYDVYRSRVMIEYIASTDWEYNRHNIFWISASYLFRFHVRRYEIFQVK